MRGAVPRGRTSRVTRPAAIAAGNTHRRHWAASARPGGPGEDVRIVGTPSAGPAACRAGSSGSNGRPGATRGGPARASSSGSAVFGRAAGGRPVLSGHARGVESRLPPAEPDQQDEQDDHRLHAERGNAERAVPVTDIAVIA